MPGWPLSGRPASGWPLSGWPLSGWFVYGRVWPAGEATAARSACSATHASTVTGAPPSSVAVRTAVRGILASGWAASWPPCS